MKWFPIMTVENRSPFIIIRDVPVSSCVAELDSGEVLLVDTGMADNHQIIDELEYNGFYPKDIDVVINTHLHPDHAGNNLCFPNARIVVSRREWLWQTDLEKRLQDSDNPLAVLRKQGRPVDESFRLLAEDLKALSMAYPLEKRVGDPSRFEWIEEQPLLPVSVRFLPAPGHTPGSYAVLIGKNLMIAGDALFHRTLWRRRDVMAGLHDSQEQFYKTARSLLRFPGMILPGHDRPFDCKGYLPSQDN